MAESRIKLQLAIRDFQSARQKAGIEEILSRLTGKSTHLLSYEEVARKLKLNVRSEGGIKTIPLEAVVGSVGRTNDFTRTFLPRRNGDQERWARVKAVFDSGDRALPPIEVYKVGQVYFVLDGNHRVSIARLEKMESIEAHVIEVQTAIPLRPDMPTEEIDQLIIKSEQEGFLAETKLTQLRPNVDLDVTACNQYEKILEQIRFHQVQLQQGRDESVPFEEAVLDWYDHAYTPAAEVIQERDLLRWFPGRTITDFYLWICEYHTELEKETGWSLNLETVATAYSLKESPLAESQAASTGVWRENRLFDRYVNKIFNDILIPISGDATSWQAVEQALILARKEGSKLHGLHVISSAEDRDTDFVKAVQSKFHELCAQSEVEGSLVIEEGEIVQKICSRARLADLTILQIIHPPLGGFSSLNSPFRAVINGASGPILGLPGRPSGLRHALIAFDGSPRSKEALFVGTYLAEHCQTSLTVLTALEEGRLPASVQTYPREYLDFHEIKANYILEKGSIHAIHQTIREIEADLVILGSYGRSVFKEIFIGSTLDFLLRESQIPLLICR